MSENKAAKDAKDNKIEIEKEAEIVADIAEVTNIAVESKPVEAPVQAFQKKGGFGGARPPRRREREEEKKEFEERVVAVDRVTRVVKGGRRMRFRALVVIGDRNGRVGYSTGKGNEVSIAVNKAVNKAKKGIVHIDIYNGTIPHDIIGKSRTTRVLLKSAKKGTGIIAGGSVRIVLELAGYSNIVSKSFGSNNKTNNVIATINGLTSLLKKAKKEGGKEAIKQPTSSKVAQAEKEVVKKETKGK